MPKRFEIREQPHPDLLDFDNGESRAQLNLFDLRVNLGGSVPEEGIVALERKLRTYRDEVIKEREKGTHLGSTQIEHGISGEIFGMTPKELGLQTEREVRLLASVVLSLAKK